MRESKIAIWTFSRLATVAVLLLLITIGTSEEIENQTNIAVGVAQSPKPSTEIEVSTDASPSIVPAELPSDSPVLLLPSSRPIEEVFVPLQKWKEQKLQDIESRVKRDVSPSSIPLPDDHHRPRTGKRQRFKSNRQLRFRELFSKTCPLPHEELVAAGLPNTSFPSPDFSLQVLNSATELTPSPVPSFEDPSTQPAPSSLVEVPDNFPSDDVTFSPVSTTAGKTNNPKAAPSPSECIPSSTLMASEGKEKNSPQLFRSIGKQVRRLRDSVSTAVNLSLNTVDNANLSDHAEDVNGGGKTKSIDESGQSTGPAIITSVGSSEESKLADSVAEAAAASALMKVSRKSFNFASEGAGAQILAASANAVGAKNIITENADKYMLVPCSGDGVGGSRWVDIELSEYVIVQNVQTANYEHYSSAAKKFAVLGAQHYPPEKWNVLGVFDFKDTRSVQTFTISGDAKRKVSRFLRVVYTGRRGTEFYCPISIFRAFGKNLIADLKDGLEAPVEKPHDGDKQNGRTALNDRQAPEQVGNSNIAPRPSGGSQSEELTTEAAEHKTDETDKKSSDRNDDSGHSDRNTDSSELTSDKGASNKVNEQGENEPAKNELSSDDQILLNVVREETLSPVSGDENIFRRVARMIRLLELNQSLTNQYIDTHLARFAGALAATQAEAARGQEAGAVAQARIAGLTAQLEDEMADMRAATLRRDMLLCALMVLIGFLLGTQWVMWTALSGPRAASATNTDIIDVTSPVSSAEGSAFTESIPPPPEPQRNNARIIETMSVDGVHVQMTDVRTRPRRRRRRGGTESYSGSSNLQPKSSAFVQQEKTDDISLYQRCGKSPGKECGNLGLSPTGAGRGRGLPPLGAPFPGRRKTMFTSNTFEPLSSEPDSRFDNGIVSN